MTEERKFEILKKVSVSPNYLDKHTFDGNIDAIYEAMDISNQECSNQTIDDVIEVIRSIRTEYGNDEGEKLICNLIMAKLQNVKKSS